MATADKREKLSHQWTEFFREYDVPLCQITPTVAFPHDARGTDMAAQFSWTITVNDTLRYFMDNLAWHGIVNVANLPATAVPTRRIVDMRLVRLQIAGPHPEDYLPLHVA